MSSYSIIALTAFLLLSSRAFAGLDKFSRIDKIENWIIERKIDSGDQQIKCRAYIPSYYSWFGGRTRLNSNGDLFISNKDAETKTPDQKIVNKVRKAIEVCNSSLIYNLEVKSK